MSPHPPPLSGEGTPDPSRAAEPVITRPPPEGRKFPCQKCGARLEFDPAAHALTCPYCGFTERIAPDSKQVRERDWEEFWHNAAGKEVVLAGRSCQVTCQACGAVVLLDDKVAADRCPYCATYLENKPEAVQGMIPPEGILPFAINERQATEAFNYWIAGRWFAPSGLQQFANLGRLNGVYVPFWTYDAMTATQYSGMRGDDYQETETYTERDANGQEVTKTRQVTKTRWTAVSGQVRHFFDDVLVCASRSADPGLVGCLPPWDLDHLEGFKDEYLGGFQAERYAVGLREGFDQARGFMDGEIRQLCCRDIGGDHQQLHTVNTQYSGITFKHLLLPVWLAAYRYQDRAYQILINGRTGKVTGTRPYSWVKIALLILAIAAVILAIVLFFTTQVRGATPGRAAAPQPTTLTATSNQIDLQAPVRAGSVSDGSVQRAVAYASGSDGFGRLALGMQDCWAQHSALSTQHFDDCW